MATRSCARCLRSSGTRRIDHQGLRPVLEHYDYTIAQWYARVDKVRSAQRQWSEMRTLPPASELGIPVTVAPAAPETTPATPAPASAAPATTTPAVTPAPTAPHR